ncbi:g928 [Coccomyxa viridis]|uniref:G928 protein n=1 Tax=Coccomyxa viridis TaxID=1274662 RepID=A0ABP1FKL8_9CHLO
MDPALPSLASCTSAAMWPRATRGQSRNSVDARGWKCVAKSVRQSTAKLRWRSTAYAMAYLRVRAST